MDAGTAAILGGAITGVVTLVASFFGPWFRDSITAGRLKKEARRAALRDEIVAVIDAFARLLRARQRDDNVGAMELHTAAAVATTRFGILLTAEEKQAEVVLGKALNAIAVMRVDVAGLAITTLQQVLPGWFRGEIRSSQIEVEYDRLIPVNAEAIKSVGAAAAASKSAQTPKEADG